MKSRSSPTHWPATGYSLSEPLGMVIFASTTAPLVPYTASEGGQKMAIWSNEDDKISVLVGSKSALVGHWLGLENETLCQMLRTMTIVLEKKQSVT